MGLREKKLFIFDLDGCIYFGHELAAGAAGLLHLLRSDGKRVRFMTNNSRELPVEIAGKLARMGLEVDPGEILCATQSVGDYLLAMHGKLVVKAAGSPSLEQALAGAGHTVLPFASPDRADCLVIGRDTGFTYDKLMVAVQEEQRGAFILSANPDLFHPGAGGARVPETGALVASIEAITGRKAATVGKPAPFMFGQALGQCGVLPDDSVMVGDNLQTDIAGGNAAGLYTVWIRHGYFAGIEPSLAGMPNAAAPEASKRQQGQPAEPVPMITPDLEVESMEALLAAYEKERVQ